MANSFNISDDQREIELFSKLSRSVSSVENYSRDISDGVSAFNRTGQQISGIFPKFVNAMQTVGRSAAAPLSYANQEFGPDHSSNAIRAATAAAGPLGTVIAESIIKSGLSEKIGDGVKGAIGGIGNKIKGLFRKRDEEDDSFKSGYLDPRNMTTETDRMMEEKIPSMENYARASAKILEEQLDESKRSNKEMISALYDVQAELSGGKNKKTGSRSSTYISGVTRSDGGGDNKPSASSIISRRGSRIKAARAANIQATSDSNSGSVDIQPIVSSIESFKSIFTDSTVKDKGFLGSLYSGFIEPMLGLRFLFSGRYAKDIPRSKNPFETMVNALIKIYEWQRIYGDLSRRQLNEIIKVSGGRPQKIVGQESIATSLLKKGTAKLKQLIDSSFGEQSVVGKALKTAASVASFFALQETEDEKNKEYAGRIHTGHAILDDTSDSTLGEKYKKHNSDTKKLTATETGTTELFDALGNQQSTQKSLQEISKKILPKNIELAEKVLEEIKNDKFIESKVSEAKKTLPTLDDKEKHGFIFGKTDREKYAKEVDKAIRARIEGILADNNLSTDAIDISSIIDVADKEKKAKLVTSIYDEDIKAGKEGKTKKTETAEKKPKIESISDEVLNVNVVNKELSVKYNYDINNNIIKIYDLLYDWFTNPINDTQSVGKIYDLLLNSNKSNSSVQKETPAPKPIVEPAKPAEKISLPKISFDHKPIVNSITKLSSIANDILHNVKYIYLYIADPANKIKPKQEIIKETKTIIQQSESAVPKEEVTATKPDESTLQNNDIRKIDLLTSLDSTVKNIYDFLISNYSRIEKNEAGEVKPRRSEKKGSFLNTAGKILASPFILGGSVIGGVGKGIGKAIGGTARGIGSAGGGILHGIGSLGGGILGGTGKVLGGTARGIGSGGGGILRGIGKLTGGTAKGIGVALGGGLIGTGKVLGGAYDASAEFLSNLFSKKNPTEKPKGDKGESDGGSGKPRGGGLSGILGYGGKLIGGAAKGIGSVIGGTTKGIGSTIGGIAQGAGKIIGGSAKGIGSAAGGILSGTSSVVKGAYKGVSKTASFIKDKAVKGYGWAKDKIQNTTLGGAALGALKLAGKGIKGLFGLFGKSKKKNKEKLVEEINESIKNSIIPTLDKINENLVSLLECVCPKLSKLIEHTEKDISIQEENQRIQEELRDDQVEASKWTKLSAKNKGKGDKSASGDSSGGGLLGGSLIGMFIMPLISGFLKKLKSLIWSAITAPFRKLWGWMKKGLSKIWGVVWGWMKKGLNKIWGSIKGIASKAWNGIKGIASKAWGGIKSAGLKAWNVIKAKGVGMWGPIQAAGVKMWNGMKTIAGTVWNSIKTGAAKLWTKIKEPAAKAAKKAGESIATKAKPIAKATKKLGVSIAEKSGSVASKGIDWIKGKAKSVDKAAVKSGGFFSGLWNKAKSGVKKLAGGATNIASKVVSGAKNAAKTVWEGAKAGAAKAKDLGAKAWEGAKAGAKWLKESAVKIGGKVLQLGKTALSKLGALSGPLLKTAKKIGQLGKSLIGKVAGKFGKSALKKIPGVSAILGVVFGLKRYAKGEYVRGTLEILSGIAGSFPGIGTLLSLAIDGGMIAADAAITSDVDSLKKEDPSSFKSDPEISSLADQVGNDPETKKESDSQLDSIINEAKSAENQKKPETVAQAAKQEVKKQQENPAQAAVSIEKVVKDESKKQESKKQPETVSQAAKETTQSVKKTNSPKPEESIKKIAKNETVKQKFKNPGTVTQVAKETNTQKKKTLPFTDGGINGPIANLDTFQELHTVPEFSQVKDALIQSYAQSKPKSDSALSRRASMGKFNLVTDSMVKTINFKELSQKLAKRYDNITPENIENMLYNVFSDRTNRQLILYRYAEAAYKQKSGSKILGVTVKEKSIGPIGKLIKIKDEANKIRKSSKNTKKPETVTQTAKETVQEIKKPETVTQVAKETVQEIKKPETVTQTAKQEVKKSDKIIGDSELIFTGKKKKSWEDSITREIGNGYTTKDFIDVVANDPFYKENIQPQLEDFLAKKYVPFMNRSSSYQRLKMAADILTNTIIRDIDKIADSMSYDYDADTDTIKHDLLHYAKYELKNSALNNDNMNKLANGKRVLDIYNAEQKKKNNGVTVNGKNNISINATITKKPQSMKKPPSISSVFDGAKNMFGKAKNKVSGFTKGIYDKYMDKVNSIKDTISAKPQNTIPVSTTQSQQIAKTENEKAYNDVTSQRKAISDLKGAINDSGRQIAANQTRNSTNLARTINSSQNIVNNNQTTVTTQPEQLYFTVNGTYANAII